MQRIPSDMIRCFLFFILLVYSSFAWSKNYYLSEKGDDRNNGRSRLSPWRTLKKLEGLRLQPGDSVLFERGSVFIGTVSVAQSGKEGKPIVFASYGTGAMPVLKGDVGLADWKAVNKDVYQLSFARKPFDLFANGRRLLPARFPNSGFLWVNEGRGKDSLKCDALPVQFGSLVGGLVRIRSNDWLYETRLIRQHKQAWLQLGNQDRYPIEKGFEQRTNNGTTLLASVKKGYGFYLEGLPAMVDTAYEWSWHQGTINLMLLPGTSPDALQITGVVFETGFEIASGVSYVVIKDLRFEQYEKAGISGGIGLQAVNIKDNAFLNIHGIGVTLDSASQKCSIEGNYFEDILGRGVSVLEPAYLSISGNNLKRIGMIPGQGWTGVNSGTGILVHSIEHIKGADSTMAHHNEVRLNRVDSCGYNGIRVDGHYNLVEYNVIDNVCLNLNDGAGIYCFSMQPGHTRSSIIRKNIVRNVVGNLSSIPTRLNFANGIYIDNNCSYMLVENNTVIRTAGMGIVNNDGAFSNTFRSNHVFDCATAMECSEWKIAGGIKDILIEQNVFAGVKPSQMLGRLTNWIGPALYPGIMRNNQYVNLSTTACFAYTTKQFPEPVQLALSFEQWKKLTQCDSTSMLLDASTNWAQSFESFILVNDRTEELVMPVNGKRWYNLEGRPVSNDVRLPPFSSLIMLRGGK